MKKEMIKPFVVGIVVGAIVLLIVIFSTGWVVTNGSAQAKAEEMAEKAVVDRLALIAVAQFMQEPNKEELLNELKKRDTYGTNNRFDYAEKQDWATMPGEKKPDSKVVKECVSQLMELKQ